MLQTARERLNEAFSPGVKSVKSVKFVKSVKVDAQSLLLEKMNDLTHLMLGFRGPTGNFPKVRMSLFPPDFHFPGVKSVKSLSSIAPPKPTEGCP